MRSWCADFPAKSRLSTFAQVGLWIIALELKTGPGTTRLRGLGTAGLTLTFAKGLSFSLVLTFFASFVF